MRWTVGNKLSAAFAAIVFGLALLAAAGAIRDARVEERVTQLYQRGVIGTQELGRASTILHRVRARGFLHIATRDPAQMRAIEIEITDLEREFDEALQKAAKTFDADDSRQAEIAAIRKGYGSYAALRNAQVFAPSNAGEIEKALLGSVGPVGDAFNRVRDQLDKIGNDNVSRTKELADDAGREIKLARWFSLGASLVIGLLAVVLAWNLSRSISQRVLATANAARRMADGELDERLPATGEDEIAELARAFNRMADELGRRIAEISANSEANAASRERLAKTVARYGAAVERIAHGDLATAVAPGAPREGGEGSDDLASLGEGLSTMARGLRDMALRVQETVSALTTATAEISATTQQQSASASESAAAVTETVTTVDEVTQSAQQTSERARAVAAAARSSVDASAAGLEAVERTIQAMAGVRDQVASIADRILGLSEQAQAVGQVVTTVNELAEQSNLLALNAAIEAARAGEHGRGFAVVAQEVRALAEQSKAATAQIRAILGEIQRSTAQAVLATEEGTKAVANAVDRVRHAGERIEQLSATIRGAAQAADQIVAATEQQVTGVGQIARAMHSIDQATTQTVEGTRQSEQAARGLAELAGRLRDAVASYRL
jgi:methyl-accepting chemotaxis protein